VSSREQVRIRASMDIVSDRVLEDRPPLVHDAFMAIAALDRLLHDASFIVMDGEWVRAGRPL
jgi:hypothetical protein